MADRGTADLSWANSAKTTHWRCSVLTWFELDRHAPWPVVSDRERSSAVLAVAFGVTDLEHLVQTDNRLARWHDLANLLVHLIDVIETVVAPSWAAQRQLFTSMNDC